MTFEIFSYLTYIEIRKNKYLLKKYKHKMRVYIQMQLFFTIFQKIEDDKTTK